MGGTFVMFSEKFIEGNLDLLPKKKNYCETLSDFLYSCIVLRT